MPFNARDWWYIIFALFNTLGLVVAVIYQVFISSIACRSLCTWVICHGVICVVYYIFMKHFYNAFQKESAHLEIEYNTLNQHVKTLMEDLGYESDQPHGREESCHRLVIERDNHRSTKIYSHELGAFVFLSVYVASLAVGLVLFSQNATCEPWFSYGTLTLILGSVLSIILQGCLRCNGIYSKS